MKKHDFFLGVDVSKKTLDLCLIKADQEQALYLQVSNCPLGYEKMMQWISSQSLNPQQGLLILEHTGLYSLVLSIYLSRHSLTYCLIPGIVLKKSLGILRGKSDKGDAFLLARYGMLYQKELSGNPIAEDVLITLQLLFSQRKRMIRALKSLCTNVKEVQQMGLTEQGLSLSSHQLRTVTALKEDIKALEKKMLSLVEQSRLMKIQYELLVSIPGVGMHLSIYLLIITHGFTRFSNPRELACFSGVAPFPYQSGTSIKGKTKIHPLCDKELKSLLHMASLNAVRYDKELKEYYERKKAQGKNAMCVLNAVRNKILARPMATVKRGTPFVPLAKHLN
jgi:transposase